MDATYAAECPFCREKARKGDGEQGYWEDTSVKPGVLEPEGSYPYRCSLGLDCVIPQLYSMGKNAEIITSSFIPQKKHVL